MGTIIQPLSSLSWKSCQQLHPFPNVVAQEKSQSRIRESVENQSLTVQDVEFRGLMGRRAAIASGIALLSSAANGDGLAVVKQGLLAGRIPGLSEPDEEGIFPFTEQVPAIRSSRNRPAGTFQTKPIQSINKGVIKSCLINQILPAIRGKWSSTESKLIFIQQDNARPHIKDSDADFRAAASQEGFDIRLVHQPPNSPDTNVNDLGWFRAIQSIQVQSVSYNVDQLVNAVLKSYEELSPQTLNKVFLSLQACMVEIMKVKGQNCYKIPHLKKDSLLRQEALPMDLEVPASLVQECVCYMIENGNLPEIEGLQSRLRLVVDDWTE